MLFRNSSQRPTSWWRSGWYALLTAALVACGGGGGGSTVSSAVATVAVLDSFGNAVENGFGAGDSGGDGTAGDGAPIPNRPVVLTDAAGRAATTTTDAQGYYRINLTGFTPPFVVKVTRADGVVRTSLSTAALKPNGFITINVTGLTDKVASDVAIAGGKRGASELTPAIVASNPSAVTASIAKLRIELAASITAAGVNAQTFDPITLPFRTNGTGYDKILDTVKVTVSPTGATVVAPVPVSTTPGTTTQVLTGNWRATLILAGGLETFDLGVVPASSIPSAASIVSTSASTLFAAVRPAVAGVGVSVQGNLVTYTFGPTSSTYSRLDSLKLDSVQSCGPCTVGSNLSYNLTAKLTEGGSSSGVQSSPFVTEWDLTYSYTRIN